MLLMCIVVGYAWLPCINGLGIGLQLIFDNVMICIVGKVDE